MSLAEIRPALEALYFVGGVVVAVASVFALNQLKMAKESLAALREQIRLAAAALDTAKDDIRIRSQREAVALAAQRCEKFAEATIPRCSVHWKALADARMSHKRWPLDDADFDDPAYLLRPGVPEWLASVEKATDGVGHLNAIANDLEA